jgi:hypothetical protein
MDLFSKGSSYENHSHNCPSISGVYPPSDDSSNISMAIHQADFCMPCRDVEVEDDFYSACSQEVTNLMLYPESIVPFRNLWTTCIVLPLLGL